jgi:hypothetical protein
VRVVEEAHRTGLFSRQVWLALLTAAGFHAEAITERTSEDRTHAGDVHRPPAGRAGPAVTVTARATMAVLTGLAVLARLGRIAAHHPEHRAAAGAEEPHQQRPASSRKNDVEVGRVVPLQAVSPTRASLVAGISPSAPNENSTM